MEGAPRGSRQESNESSKEKKESKPAETDVSADEIRKMVAKFLKELASNTNPKKAPRLLNKISEEKIRALGFMCKLKYVTDPELIDKYIEAEACRKAWFESKGWDFTRAQRRPEAAASDVVRFRGGHPRPDGATRGQA